MASGEKEGVASTNEPLALPRTQTLKGGLRTTFPGSSWISLRTWGEKARQTGYLEPEFLFLLTIVCGQRYRVARVDPELVLGDLERWFTSSPRNMPPELAELMVDALSQPIRRVLNKRGWYRGPDREPLELNARPPLNPRAWAATCLVNQELRTVGIQEFDARILAQEFASILLGRSVAENEFYEERKRFEEQAKDSLLGKLHEAYERLVDLEASRQDYELQEALTGKPKPPPESEEYRAWRMKFRGLHNMLAMEGTEWVARTILQGVPNELWPE